MIYQKSPVRWYVWNRFQRYSANCKGVEWCWIHSQKQKNGTWKCWCPNGISSFRLPFSGLSCQFCSICTWSLWTDKLTMSQWQFRDCIRTTQLGPVFLGGGHFKGTLRFPWFHEFREGYPSHQQTWSLSPRYKNAKVTAIKIYKEPGFLMEALKWKESSHQPKRVFLLECFSKFLCNRLKIFGFYNPPARWAPCYKRNGNWGYTPTYRSYNPSYHW